MGLWGKLGFYDPWHIPKNPDKPYCKHWVEPMHYNSGYVRNAPTTLDDILRAMGPSVLKALQNDPELAARTSMAVKDICLRLGVVAGDLAGSALVQMMQDAINQRK